MEFPPYSPPPPTPKELRRRLDSARRQLKKLQALRRRARSIRIEIAVGFGLRIRCFRRPPNFLADIFAASPIWEQDDICRLTFCYAAQARQWAAELKRAQASLRLNEWPFTTCTIPLKTIYTAIEWDALLESREAHARSACD